MNVIKKVHNQLMRKKTLQLDTKAIYPTCKIADNCITRNIELGKYVSLFDYSLIIDSKINDFSYVSYHSNIQNTVIGKYCSIAQNVQIGLSPHPTKSFVSTHPIFFSADNSACAITLLTENIYDDSVKPTNVGNDVWLGQNVIVPGGISIGNGAIVAAGSVVVKDVPDYAIVGGNPAKIIRFRFDEHEIKYLLNTKWWDWPFDKVKKNVELFTNLEEFKKHF